MTYRDKITEIFRCVDDFCKRICSEELKMLPDKGKKHRNRSCEMSDSEIITIYNYFLKTLKKIKLESFYNGSPPARG